jgi:hypothetical protein
MSRRRLLALLGGAGAAGTVGGLGSAALLADEEGPLSGLITSGSVDLEVDTAAGTADGNVVSVPIDLTPGETDGSTVFTVTLPETDENNPAYLWFRSFCPEPETELADALQVTLSYDCDPGDQLFPADGQSSGSLGAFAEWALAGQPLSPTCERVAAADLTGLEPGDKLKLRLDWELADGYYENESTSLDLEFHGRQRRNTTAGENPFPAPTTTECGGPTVERHGISNIVISTADGQGGCSVIGKLDLSEKYVERCGSSLDVTGDDDADGVPDHDDPNDGDSDVPNSGGSAPDASPIGDSFIAPGRYDLPEEGDDPSCTDSGYDLVVTSTTTKDGGAETTGIAFEVVAPDGSTDLELCEVEIKGGPTTETYTDGDLSGNATVGTLAAPEKNPGGE